MFIAVWIVLLIGLALLIIRALKGPTVFDRILAANSLGSGVVAAIVVLGFGVETEFYIDIALMYALINFIMTIAFLRYFQSKMRMGE